MERLCDLYDPQGVIEAFELPDGAEWLKSESPIPNHRNRRGPRYHRGRVRHFMNQLLDGVELDPVEVCHASPEFFLSDGHHRFMAHVYAKWPTIRVTYLGDNAVLRYLEGRRSTCPSL